MFAYFGDNLFGKLQNFKNRNSEFCSNTVKLKIFNTTDFTADTIDELYLGWSCIIYRLGNKFYHAGFSNLDEDHSEVFKNIGNELTISCGAVEIYAFSNEGDIFYYSTKNAKETISLSNKRNHRIRDLKIGDHHTVILFDDGKACHLKLQENDPFIPLQIESSITQIACGKEHVLFLSATGQVFSYGNGSRGQLGHGTIENQDSPMLLEALDGLVIKSIACGGWHSAAVSDSGDLYVWGWNESGQLGFPCTELHSNDLPLSEIETVCCLPKPVEFKKELQVESVSCGARHTVILTEDFEVWSWGWNQYGQLGHGEYLICDEPCKISFPSEFVPKSVKCAFWSTLISGSLSV